MNLNETFSMDTLVGHLIANNITYRPVHILKVDIEGDEWEVFEHLAKEPILDIVGQIAVEVHVEEILKLRTEEIFGYLKDVTTFEISRDPWFLPWLTGTTYNWTAGTHAPEGSQHDVCGELLYVNTKWYNDTFKRTLRESGIPVKLNAVT
nr:uncharacterized protein LOC113804236 [Penaeus vannamei]